MKTLQVRIKDKHAKVLDTLACEVNMIWNFCNELSYKHTQRTGKYFSGFELQYYTKGVGKEGFIINSASVQMVGAEFVTRRKQFKKNKLKWRTSYGKRKSLGWIPFRHDCIKYKNGQLHYAGFNFSIWDSYDLSKYELGSGSFSQDSRGRWYANITVEDNVPFVLPTVESIISKEVPSIGIDLGLKDFATFSTGEKVIVEQFYRKEEPKLKIAQRANNKKRVKNIHTKIKNKRKDQLHKLSSELVKGNAGIFVGDISSAKLVKTNMAKSVLDAGWSSFKGMLRYKSIRTGVLFIEVNEKYSTVTCSVCKSRTGPKGLEGLQIREWKCSCGVGHDRDHNAALNILAAGHRRLAEGIPAL